jgi:hypothetical protein
MPTWKSRRRDGTLLTYTEQGEKHFMGDLGYVERLPRPDEQHPWRGVALKKIPHDNMHMNFNTCEEAKTWVEVVVRMQS